MSPALRLGGGGVVPESLPAGPVLRKCPGKGQRGAALATHALPPTAATRMEMGRRSQGELAVTDARESRDRTGSGASEQARQARRETAVRDDERPLPAL